MLDLSCSELAFSSERAKDFFGSKQTKFHSAYMFALDSREQFGVSLFESRVQIWVLGESLLPRHASWFSHSFSHGALFAQNRAMWAPVPVLRRYNLVSGAECILNCFPEKTY